MPNYYAAFGLTIESSIELPDLRRSGVGAQVDWRVRVERGEVPSDVAVAIGADTVFEGVQVRAFATTAGLRLVYDDTGTFDIRSADRVIAWYPGTNTQQADVRADLLGRVIAVAAHASGRIALHASAVAIDGRAIAFVGPKHAGKSTLALALVQSGARLVTDDMLVIRFDPRGRAWAAPGVQRLRLWEDSARALGAPSTGAAGAKPALDCLTPRELEPADGLLAACYVVQGSDRGPKMVHRERLSPVHAALACLRHSKLGSLAGGSAGRVTLDRVAQLTRVVPVFDLAVPRDLTVVRDVAASLVAWHGVARKPAVGVPA